MGVRAVDAIRGEIQVKMILVQGIPERGEDQSEHDRKQHGSQDAIHRSIDPIGSRSPLLVAHSLDVLEERGLVA
jgi:hypothetical protein